jgi:hypothetical protein
MIPLKKTTDVIFIFVVHCSSDIKCFKKSVQSNVDCFELPYTFNRSLRIILLFFKLLDKARLLMYIVTFSSFFQRYHNYPSY